MRLSFLRFCFTSLQACAVRRCYWKSGSFCTRQTILPKTPKSALCTTTTNRMLVLGIETSCDDTGAAVVNEKGEIIGEALHAQTSIHVE